MMVKPPNVPVEFAPIEQVQAFDTGDLLGYILVAFVVVGAFALGHVIARKEGQH